MKKIISTLLISAMAIFIGYWAMALPFHLFENLTGMQMRIIFVCEILVYFAIFSAFFLIKEAKEIKLKKAEEIKKRDMKRIQQCKQNNEMWADFFNTAA